MARTAALNSTSLIEAEWDDGKLIISFQDGTKHSYADVPEEVYEDLIGSPSVGKFFNQNIRGHYEATEEEA